MREERQQTEGQETWVTHMTKRRNTGPLMSQRNVEVVLALFEAWNAGDMDAVRALYHPDVIVRTPEDWPELGPWVGREAVMRQWNQQRETFDADDLKLIDHSIDVGDRVAVRYIWRIVGHGPESNLEMTAVHTVRKGRIFGQEFFWDHAEALDTLGLSEKEAPTDSPE
jgi:ketosteroid isomerase-like protein